MQARRGTPSTCMTLLSQEGIDAIGDVIYHVETFDTTTVSGARGMHLLETHARLCAFTVASSFDPRWAFLEVELSCQIGA